MTLRASFLMAGSVRVADRGPRRRTMLPSCSRPSRTLRAAEGGGPEDGPILDRHCARRLGLRRSGRKDGPRSNRRMRGDFPLPLPTWSVENSGSGSPACVSPSPSVSEVGVLSIATIRILLRSTLQSPHPFYARKFNPTDAKTFIAAADTKKAMVKIGDANRS